MSVWSESPDVVKSQQAAMIKIIDMEMRKINSSLTVGKTPLDSVHKLLSKLDSIWVSKRILGTSYLIIDKSQSI